MASSLGERLATCYTGAVHDVMRVMGFRDFVLPAEIRPLDPARKLCGSVFTVNGHVETGADAHQTLLAWTGLLSRVPADTVIACQPNDSSVAHMGELSAETLHVRGVRGYIVDGGCRDAEFILRLGFPVWCRYLTPRDVVGYWVPDGYEIPIRTGRVLIHNGDYALADRDGVVILPAQAADEIVTRTEEVGPGEPGAQGHLGGRRPAGGVPSPWQVLSGARTGRSAAPSIGQQRRTAG